MGFDVQGGGSDLVFPHHEYSAVHAEALTGHQALRPGLRARGDDRPGRREDEQEPSGNLVFVSRLRGDGVDPMAIRLALLSGHYRTDRSWTPDLLTDRPGAAGHLAAGRRPATPGRPAAPLLRGPARAAGRRPRQPRARSRWSTPGPRDTLAGGRRRSRTRRRGSSATPSTPCWVCALGRLRMTARAVPAHRPGRARARGGAARPGGDPGGGHPRPGAPRGGGPAADGVRARPRPDPARQGLPPPQAQDAGLPQPRRRPLRHPAHPHAAGHPGRALAGPGARAQRDARRGDRARPRRRPLAVRPPRRGRAGALRPRRLAPRGAGGADRRGARAPEPDLGGARRHPGAQLEDRPAAGHPRGRVRAVRRPDRLPLPRRARRDPGRGAAPRRPAGPGPRGLRRAGQRRWSAR